MGTFKRTILFSKSDSGVITRIPWDFVNMKGLSGMSPAPVQVSPFDDVDTTNTVTPSMEDMRFKSGIPIEDEIERLEWYPSENDLYVRTGLVNGFYDSDPSLEFGYPVS